MLEITCTCPKCQSTFTIFVPLDLDEMISPKCNVCNQGIMYIGRRRGHLVLDSELKVVPQPPHMYKRVEV